MAISGESEIDRDERASKVRTLFSEIAPRYDLLNHVLSLNVDRRWRRRAVDVLASGALNGQPAARARGGSRHGIAEEKVPIGGGRLVLDLCAGTYDLSLELAHRQDFVGRVVALDFARPMLAEGSRKLSAYPVSPVCADALVLPFPDRVFDSVMVAFGVRNLADLGTGLREVHRVLRPGGRFIVLDFATPPRPALRSLYLFYFHKVLPRIGRLVSGHEWAYSYLPDSVRGFPEPDELGGQLAAAGFEQVEWRYLTAGIAALHVARRRK